MDIYYFSGTGNSYLAAKKISENVNDVKLISITEAVKWNTKTIKEKKVGFVFPLYFHSLPKIVLEFVENLEFEKVEYIFSIVTRAGKINAGALSHLDKILKSKNKFLSYGRYIQLPGNYILISDSVPNKEKQEKYFNIAYKNLLSFSKQIDENFKILDSEPIAFLSPILHNQFIKRVNKIDTNFNTNAKCNNCRLCKKICKLDNITLESNGPKWHGKCQSCLACMNYCPMEAIEYKKSTIGRKRYVNPNLSVKEYIKI